MAKGLYDGLVEYEAVPQAYLDKWTPKAYEMIVLGGYRLASLLEYIFIGKDLTASAVQSMLKQANSDLMKGGKNVTLDAPDARLETNYDFLKQLSRSVGHFV